MLRLRLAFLALASGMLVTSAGCLGFNNNSECRSSPRLFQGNLMSRLTSRNPVVHHEHADCECHGAHLMPHTDIGIMPGPQFPNQFVPPMPGPSPMPIPITNVPAGQPPAVFKVPQASPMPYVPTN